MPNIIPFNDISSDELAPPPAIPPLSGGGSPFGSGAGIGNGIGDIFGAIGDFAEASNYNKAAGIADQNAQIVNQSTRIQQAQEQRKLFQVTGQESAAAGGSNLSAGGSVGDVMRSSLQQSGLQHQLIGLQGAVEENSFLQQAQAYKGQAQSAEVAGVGGFVNGIASFFGI